jgi:membrane protease YdiL (CAAX protease family)
MHVSALSWDCAAILAGLAILLPWRGVARIRYLLSRPDVGPAERLAMYSSTIAFQWAVAGVTAWRVYVRGWSAASLGLAMDRPLLAWLVGLFFALVLAGTQFASLRQLARTPDAQRGIHFEMLRKLMPQSPFEAIPFVALVVTVSICEEFLYRGFVFAALARVFDNSVIVATAGSAALFAFGHLYQGRRGLISTFILGLMFAAMRVWTGSLVPCILVHLVTDLVAGIAGPRLLQRGQLAPQEAAHEA